MSLALPVCVLFLVTGSRNRSNAAGDPALACVFVGSSPGGKSISRLLQIPPDVEPPVQWELTLVGDDVWSLHICVCVTGELETPYVVSYNECYGINK